MENTDRWIINMSNNKKWKTLFRIHKMTGRALCLLEDFKEVNSSTDTLYRPQWIRNIDCVFPNGENNFGPRLSGHG